MSQFRKFIISLMRALVLGIVGVTTVFVLVPLLGLSLPIAFALAGGLMVLAAYVAMAPSQYQILLSIAYISISTGMLVSSVLGLFVRYGRLLFLEAQRNPIAIEETIVIFVCAIFFAIACMFVLRIVGLDIHWKQSRGSSH